MSRDIVCSRYSHTICYRYQNTGTCVMWTEVCDDSVPICPYPSCDNVYHFNRFDCATGKDWGAFHLQKDRTQLRGKIIAGVALRQAACLIPPMLQLHVQGCIHSAAYCLFRKILYVPTIFGITCNHIPLPHILG